MEEDHEDIAVYVPNVAIPLLSEKLGPATLQRPNVNTLPPGVPGTPSTHPKEKSLADLKASTSTIFGNQNLPAPSAKPTSTSSGIPAATGDHLTNESEIFVNGGGDKSGNNNFSELGIDIKLSAQGGNTADKVVKEIKNQKEKKPGRKVVVDDFEMIRVLGKGCAGKVLLVKHRSSAELYALKAITKRQVIAHQELQHILTEQAVLRRMAREGRNPFVVKLWWSFHNDENLFLVMDFHPGGDLATQLARGNSFSQDRVRFYAAEIVEGCEGLHAAGVIHRDLTPENILIGADGHIVLTDFGLSKEFPRKLTNQSPATRPTPSGQTRFVNAPYWMDIDGSPGHTSTNRRPNQDMTTTFCGTANYLAPEVIQGLPYSYEVDWWSFGTILYEMLTGTTPFWANNQSVMFNRVLWFELQFPSDKEMDQDTKSLIRGLLQRNPALRMCGPMVKEHPYFSMIDWLHVYHKRYIPPYMPPINPSDVGDTQNFDKEFLNMRPVIADKTDQTNSDCENSDWQSARSTTSSMSPQSIPAEEKNKESVDVFDVYSLNDQDSIIIDDDEEESDEGSERVRGKEALEPEAGTGLITADKEVTPRTTPSNFLNSVAWPGKPKPPKPVSPTKPKVFRPPALPAKPKLPKPAAPPALDVVQLPPPPVEKLDELAEPIVPPVTARAISLVPIPPPVSPAPESSTSAAHKQKRKKSDVTGLDRVLDADTDKDDWDLVEQPKGKDQAHNGSGGKLKNSLLARGMIDRYSYATTFRKASHSSLRRSPELPPTTTEPNCPKSKATVHPQVEDTLSPATHSGLRRHGRLTSLGLNFQQLLRAKTPPTPILDLAADCPHDTNQSPKESDGSTPRTPSKSKRRGPLSRLGIRSNAPPSARAKPTLKPGVPEDDSRLLSPPPNTSTPPLLKSRASSLPRGQPRPPVIVAKAHGTHFGGTRFISTSYLPNSFKLRLTMSRRTSQSMPNLSTSKPQAPQTPIRMCNPPFPASVSTMTKPQAPQAPFCGNDPVAIAPFSRNRPDSYLHTRPSAANVTSASEAQNANDHLGEHNENGDVLNSNILRDLAYDMHETLVKHGCLDLGVSIDPNAFSSSAVAEGGFGDIWAGRLYDGTKLAIKVLRFTLVTDIAQAKKQLKRIMREMYNWSKLDHENIHQLMGVTMFRERLGMVSMWMSCGNLRQYLNQHSDVDRYQLCVQIANGVAYIHSVNMIHGDLKACNILVSSDGILKLTDFDHSIISNCSLVLSTTSRTVGGGTLRWMAPELLMDENPPEKNKETDIYALGMTLLETMTNAHPYSECQHENQILLKLMRRDHPTRSMEYFPDVEQSNRIWTLLVQCWDYNPAYRPTADDALATVKTQGLVDGLEDFMPPILPTELVGIAI